MINAYKNPGVNGVYNLFFCDDLDFFRENFTGPIEPPFDALFAKPVERSAMEKIVGNPDEESRLKALAFNQLKRIGALPEKPELLGVIVEVGMPKGLDSLAAYKDGSARLINSSENVIVSQDSDFNIQDKISRLIAQGESIKTNIGLSDQKRQSPPKNGSVRLTLLLSDGLHVANGSFQTIDQETMNVAAELMGAMVDKALASLSKQGPPPGPASADDPKAIVYGPDRAKAVVMLVFAIGFSVLGYFTLEASVGFGALLLGVGLLGALSQALTLAPGSTFLRLAPNGLTVKRIYRTTFVPWQDILEFDIAYVAKYTKAVVYRLVESKRGTSALQKTARGLNSFDGSIGRFYAIGNETLCGVLQNYLEEVRQATGVDPTAALGPEGVGRRTPELKASLIVFGFAALVLIVVASFCYPKTFKRLTGGGHELEAVVAKEPVKETPTGTPAPDPEIEALISQAAQNFQSYGTPQKQETVSAPVLPEPVIDEPQPAKDASSREDTFQKATQKLAESPEELPPIYQASSDAEENVKSLHLKNGQVMSVRIVNRDNGGVWIELDGGGGKVYFTNDEIAKIDE